MSNSYKVSKKAKYSLNHSFFNNIENQYQAYILGFIYADGTLEPKRNCLRINQHCKDIDILEKINKCFESDKPIRINEKRNMCELEIVSPIITEQLIKFGVQKNKTFITKFPDFLSNDLLNHFIRGIMDGDGGIYYAKNKNMINKSCVVHFTGTENICESIGTIFQKCLDCNYYMSTRHKERNNNIRSISIGGSLQSKKVLDYIYQNCLIFMDRKYNLYKNFDIITKSQERKRKKTSKYYGVLLKNGKWICQIRINGKIKQLGTFLLEEEAAITYNKKLIEIGGNLRKLNLFEKNYNE